jgi:YfiH family protein
VTPALLHPAWAAPASVGAAVTLRHPGTSLPPYDGLNLAYHTGDDPGRVADNRRRLAERLDAENIQWLEQVHGTRVLEAGPRTSRRTPKADGAVTSVPGLACAVMVADCLPVLVSTRRGDRVGALHVGWRGLLAGVVEAGVAALSADPAEIVAWLGPCISRVAYQVGPEVRDAFLDMVPSDVGENAFAPSAGTPEHWLMDLRAIAGHKLARLGVRYDASPRCAFGEAKRFFSYRRDGVTGRFAALVWVKG